MKWTGNDGKGKEKPSGGGDHSEKINTPAFFIAFLIFKRYT